MDNKVKNIKIARSLYDKYLAEQKQFDEKLAEYVRAVGRHATIPRSLSFPDWLDGEEKVE